MGLASCGASGTGPVTLRFSRWASIEESRRFQAVINAFVQAHPEIRVEAEYLPWDAYWEKLAIALETGDAPDVFMLSSQESDRFVLGGKLQPLEDFDRGGTFSQFNDASKMPVDSGEHLYGIPVGIAMPVLFYNRALLRQAGLPEPSPTEALSWDGFAALLARLKAGDGSAAVRYPLWMGAGELAENLFNVHGTPLFYDQVHQDELSLDAAQARLALEQLASLYRAGLLPPAGGEGGDQGAATAETAETALASGKVAFAYTGMWAIPLFHEAGLDYGTMPLPMDAVQSPRGNINYLAMPAAGNQLAAAWTMLEWLATEGQELVAASGDYPANMYHNPVELPGDIPAAVYQTLASEKAVMVPALTIRNVRVRELWNNLVDQVSRQTRAPADALEQFLRDAGQAGAVPAGKGD